MFRRHRTTVKLDKNYEEGRALSTTAAELLNYNEYMGEE